LHYLALRHHELRDVQFALIERGLSSLGILDQQLLAQASYALFGEHPVLREARIMVTMPAEAAEGYTLLSELLEAGMDVMRINCAHDNADAWQQMIANLRLAEARTHQQCRVQLDLAGPKLRTGTLGVVGRVIKLKPVRDVFGHVHLPGRIWLIPQGEVAVVSDFPALEVAGADFNNTQVGDYLVLQDARDAPRQLRIAAKHQHARLVTTDHTVYLQENTQLTFERHGKAFGAGSLINVHEVTPPLALSVDDILVLTRADTAGSPAQQATDDAPTASARIHCTLAEAFLVVREGQQVWLDDGKIGGIVEHNDGDEISVRITQTPPGGAKLRAEKGINFPDTVFDSPALTDKDVADLETMAGKVDMVALSFVRTPQDVANLQAHLQRLGIPGTGIVLKIENRAAFENLPAILLMAMRSPTIGVMIARSDLAVEVGFERLSEVQEEILWLCEAAHIPVIWATQILEGMAKKGAPSRAEVSDAAMSIRAECAMLNKGSNIVETVRFLDGILQRMEGHYHKRRLMMRPLSVCQHGGL
jgi:pyruvate kinase